MTNNITAIHRIINKAAEEAGIRENEEFKVNIISSDNDLLEFELLTEWTVVSCYADLESTQILGLMTVSRTIEELLSETVTARVKVAGAPLRAA